MIFQRLARQYLRGGAPWMLNRFASTFFESIGAVLDTEAQRVLDGRLAAIPYAGAGPGSAKLANGQRIECQPDALPYHFRDRQLRDYTTLPVLGKRIRLSQWHQIWGHAGTHLGEMMNVQPYFADAVALPTIRIVHQAGDGTRATWHTLDPSGVYSVHRASPSNWDFDSATAKWARWWVIVHLPPGYGSAFHYDDGPTYDSGAIYDGVTTTQVNDIVGLLKEFKGAHSRLAGVILTSLQPSDDIPGYPGRHPFDPTDSAIIDPAGWTSLPVQNWGSSVYLSGPNIGLATMPPWASLVYSDNP